MDLKTGCRSSQRSKGLSSIMKKVLFPLIKKVLSMGILNTQPRSRVFFVLPPTQYAGDDSFASVRLSVRPSVRLSVIAISQERINLATPNCTWDISGTISLPLLILKKIRFKMAEQCRHLENPSNCSSFLNIGPIGSIFFLKCSELAQEFISSIRCAKYCEISR